jgi:UDP-N-acetylmuramoyl-L-alanyl-D-glutamate--2,6-diaminopimelate ligase
MKFSDIPEMEALFVEKPPAVTFTGVQCDSRRVRPGDLFVAVTGYREDGAKYGAMALSKGAVAVISEHPLRDCAKSLILVKDARQALALLACAVNGRPSHALELFGITGTNGKTTTAWLLQEMLKEYGQQVGLLTTVQISYLNRVIPAVRTTPDACELQAQLAAMVAAGCHSAVMEVSSHALDQQRVAGVRFAGAAFTNLSQDHLDYHKTMAEYWEAKKKLFAQLAKENPGAPAVVFVDAAYGPEMAEYVASLPLKLITCGFTDKACLRAMQVTLTPDGSTFNLECSSSCGRVPSFSIPVKSHLAGRYNIANMLCAAAMALQAGVSPDSVVAVLQRVTPQWGRLERVPLKTSFRVFVDYAHTDDALTQVLSAIREMGKGRILVVFGCGGDRDRKKRPLMGAACARGADVLIVTSDNPRSEDPDEIIKEILVGIPSGTDFLVEPDRRAAIRRALSLARADDIVLVAGKGHEAFQEVAGRILPFDDRLVVKEEFDSISSSLPNN